MSCASAPYGRKAVVPDVTAWEEGYGWYCPLRATYPYLLGLIPQVPERRPLDALKEKALLNTDA
jgi:hypothetical protein